MILELNEDLHSISKDKRQYLGVYGPLVGDWYPQDQRHSTGSQLHTHTQESSRRPSDATRKNFSKNDGIQQRTNITPKKLVFGSYGDCYA